MTEEKFNALRQTDANLRDALRMDEVEVPKMPADLNERLMQRVAAQEQKKPRHIVWPWIAAACVAGVMMIWLTPPKDTPTDVVAENKPVVEQPSDNDKEEKPEMAKGETEAPVPMPTPVRVRKAQVQTTFAKRDAALVAQETKAEEPIAQPVIDEVHNDLAVAQTAKTQEKSVTLTERDIPITRPENYKYTPEEIALLKKQANEAYLRWAELELEIAKHNLEQTASK